MTPDANFKAKKLDKNGAEKEAKSKSEQLADPPSVGSPTQLAILLYDILKVGIIDKKNSRGTGEEILNKISLPICNLILQKRGVEKLLGTYIDKLPACVSPVDHRLHANFQQIDTATGRFASNSPNLQNIPSHEKSIRKMFVAGYTDPKYVECIDSNKYEYGMGNSAGALSVHSIDLTQLSQLVDINSNWFNEVAIVNTDNTLLYLKNLNAQNLKDWENKIWAKSFKFCALR